MPVAAARRVLFGVCALAALAACAGDHEPDGREFLARHSVAEPQPQLFTACHGYGCVRRSEIRLSEDEWERIRALFRPPPVSARDERIRVAAAIAALEKIVGERNGTDRDVGGTFKGFARRGQLDCVDEALNTTGYVLMLKADGLLRWHRPRNPAGRGFFFDSWPHTTAVVTETASATDYAVDSWFHRNGAPPEVVPLEAWQDGWTPEGFSDP